MSSCNYKLGYLMNVCDGNDWNTYEWLHLLSQQCEKFVLGIPDEWVIARLYGDRKKYSAKERQEFWMKTGWFSEVRILDAEHLSYQKMYDELQFDACYYGSEYGLPFEADKKFMESKGVAFISVMPMKYQKASGADALKVALENVQRRQKIILFGTGTYFDLFLNSYGEKYRPAYAVDNDSSKWNTTKADIIIESPEKLMQENAEDVLIILCSKEHQEMVSQLAEMGSYNYRILRYRNATAVLEEFAISAEGERIYLERAHETLLILMKEFNRVCKKYHLHYYMICGTLIGAIRHQDFIPWDDDVDLAMTRADYKKLCRAAKNEWNNDTFRWQPYDELGNGAFLDFMPRLFYMKEKLPTKVFTKVYGKATADVEDRPFLDIYVMDNAHKNQKIHMLVMNMMKGVYNLCMGHRAFIEYEGYKRKMSDNMIRFMKVLHAIGRHLPLKLLTGVYEILSRSANWNRGCTDYFMNACAITCIERKFDKEFFGEGQWLPYHDIEVMVPKDCDGILLAMGYKGYMELPRLSIRKPSHYFNSDIEIW